MTSKSKAWMSPEKTDNVYLLKLQKKKKENKKRRRNTKSSNCIFLFTNIYSKAEMRCVREGQCIKRVMAEANSSVYSPSMAVLALIGLQVTPEVRARDTPRPLRSCIMFPCLGCNHRGYALQDL